jgi:hypothetical protein
LSQPEIGFAQESIEVLGTAQLDGRLQIVLAEGVSPAPLDEFILLRSNARSGYFSSAILPPLSDGMFWNIDYTTNAVTLSVTDSFTAPALKPSLLPWWPLPSPLCWQCGWGLYPCKLPRIC